MLSVKKSQSYFVQDHLTQTITVYIASHYLNTVLHTGELWHLCVLHQHVNALRPECKRGPPVTRWPEQNAAVNVCRGVTKHACAKSKGLPLSVPLCSCIWSGQCWSLWSLIRAAQRRLCAVVWRVRPSWTSRSSIANHFSTLTCSISVVRNSLNGRSRQYRHLFTAFKPLNYSKTNVWLLCFYCPTIQLYFFFLTNLFHTITHQYPLLTFSVSTKA